MSTEENKALYRRYWDAINKQNLAVLDELCAPDFVFHGAPPGTPPGLAGVKPLHTAGWTAFPDMHYTVEDVIAEGDKVAARFTVRGTHQGDFMGIPPTGQQVSWTGINIARIEDDKFVEGWTNWDALGLMRQLGAIPQMAQTGA